MNAALTHLTALGRAELTLLARNKTNLFTVLFVPVLLTVALKPMMTATGQADAGREAGATLISMSLGIVLVMAVYNTLTPVYATRRDELLLKRLRTGEVSDVVILLGAAVPMALTGLAQCLLLALGISFVADVPAPRAPHLAVLGVLLGIVVMTAMAAATSAMAKTSESAQVAIIPGMIVFLMGSGMLFPLEVMPEAVQAVCTWLPLTPVIELIQTGWNGESTAGEAGVNLLIASIWSALSVLAVKRWFRWEPRS
ncbi:ABC transporter permease [Streptomyces sp. ALI-76-A]|jgi:ABC-2 type transport system permease protein|uniref:ABC transporter permease n=1 Tax=Streptomyces sp. ALI-76-A TaxID=3025736 RepID=UPI00256F5B77|nr:ABC transporter permease [Streptomyces sp. ALI-76-A]MDL5206010.1 ABC transporter permease [Streptomyces sp. ALI-76-A]